jgi:UDP-GlcNAc:undecaprenyl-phosphate GlcNAc-1-phosphate transferase
VSSIAALAALPAAALVIGALLRSPARRRLVAAPAADRWHDAPTPLFGGLGIFLGFAVGLGAAVATPAIQVSSELIGIVSGCAILFAAGFVDDVYHLGPIAKLAAQGAAAAAVLIGGIRVEVVGNDVIATILAVVWLVGVTNAFNLLDNMDGLAATLAAIAAGFSPRARASSRSTSALAGRRSSSWATRAARCWASRSRPSGWRRATRSPARRWRRSSSRS